MEDNTELFLKIIKEVLKTNPNNIKDSDSAETIKSWNSMTHMKLISRLEKELKKKFDINDIIQIKTIGDLKNMLSKYQIDIQ